MTILIGMIESAAVTVLAVLFLAFLGDRLSHLPWIRGVAYGIAFAIAGLVCMASPVEIEPGYLMDARAVTLALAGAIGGPVSAAITAIAMTVLRIQLGGAGMAGGIFYIWVMAIAGSLVWVWRRRRDGRRLTIREIVFLAAVGGLTPLISLLPVTGYTSPEAAREMVLYIVPTNVIGILVFGILIAGEAQRRWAMVAQAEGRAQLQAIANNAPGILFEMYLDESGRTHFRYVSEGAERVLGLTADEIMARASSIARMMSPKSLAELEELISASRDSGQPWESEVQFLRPDGRVLWMRVAAEPRLDAEGRLVWDGSIFDITDRKNVEQMRNDFIATVSHELRTPLTSIRGSLGLMAAGAAGELTDKARHLIGIAHSSAERLVRLINDILDIEKIESGRMPFDLQPMRLAPQIAQSIENSRGYLADRNIAIEFRDKAPGAEVRIDPDRFEQVMSNLLSNALKHSPAGDTVTVTLERRDTGLSVSVRDNGPGIPPAFRDRIFGKFEQADTSDAREKGGTGLGLSIVKAIVERLGGSISFETEAGSGTTFQVLLHEHPAAPPLDELDYERPREPRILICGNDAEVGTTICNLLENSGLVCDVAPDIATARRLLGERDYRLLIADIELPAPSPVELLRGIRQANETAGLPVIVISAEVDNARRSLAGNVLGIVRWLDKPIDTEQLAKAVEEVLAGLHAERPQILHVEDDEDVLAVIEATLGADVEVSFARDSRAARNALAARRFDLVILDLGLPDGHGAELLTQIPAETAVIIFSAMEIDLALASRVSAALTKTRSSELELASLAHRLLALGTPGQAAGAHGG